jgi:hypothetical protein
MADDLDDDDLEDLPGRDEDLSKRAEVRQHVLKLYEDVQQGFQDQAERSDDNAEYWDIYNCILGNHQFYTGNTRIFLPIVHDAVNARSTRFCNQLFPRNGRYIDVISDDGSIPHQPMALAENYVRKAKCRSWMPALVKNGDLEGHYHIYVEWLHAKRIIARKQLIPKQLSLGDGQSADDPDEEVEDIVETAVPEDYPTVEVLGDSDVSVLPTTASSLKQALAQGGSATILRRWSKAKIKQLIHDGIIDRRAGEDLLDEMSKDLKTNLKNKDKDMIDAAGIKKDGKGKHCLVYEIWNRIKIKGHMLTCRIFMAGQDKILSVKRNPLWCDRLPLISAPVRRTQGVFKGRSLVAHGVKDVQYYANDVINEAADSSAFSMMPIVMTDPEKNPRVGSMVLSLGAVWLTNPKDTAFAQFPPLWRDGLEIVAKCREQIFQTLSVNPAQITQQAGQKQGAKRNQAEIANEQQVDILTTIDATTVLEEGILSPMVTLFMEMDAQYRSKAMTVPRYGELGRTQKFDDIPPLQMDRRYQFFWMGVEAARAAQELQQQIAFLNVLKGIPPQSYPGYQLQLAPAIVNACERVFGPRLAPLIFVDVRSQMNQDPMQENMQMLLGSQAFVHSLDNHQQHIAVHQKMAQLDPSGKIGAHILEHQQAMQLAMRAQQEAMNPRGVPGSPGAAGQPGIAGRPRAGAQPGQPRPVQNPAGAVHRDRMPLAMPRKM